MDHSGIIDNLHKSMLKNLTAFLYDSGTEYLICNYQKHASEVKYREFHLCEMVINEVFREKLRDLLYCDVLDMETFYKSYIEYLKQQAEIIEKDGPCKITVSYKHDERTDTLILLFAFSNLNDGINDSIKS
jgi:hypothetical protein